MTSLELAERALAAAGGDGALASVTTERSLMLRYARSRPTQATAIDDLTVGIAVLRGGRVGTASTNFTDDEFRLVVDAASERGARVMAEDVLAVEFANPGRIVIYAAAKPPK